MTDPQSVSMADSLEELLSRCGETVTIREIVAKVEDVGGLAPVLFVLSLPVMLPLPPGATTITAMPLLLVAPQMILGRRSLWLPERLACHRIPGDKLCRGLRGFLPWVERLERLVRPRLSILTGRAGEALVGLICTLLGIVLVLPVPFGNILPGLAVALLALGLTRRDGLVMIMGLSAVGVSAWAITLALAGIGNAVDGILDAFWRPSGSGR